MFGRRKMKKIAPTPNKLDILISPGFLLGLCLLLVNDYYLKQAFPGLITGKLSDFSGLFVFGLCVVLINHRHLPVLLTLVGLLFVLWKSNFSDYFITLWNLNGHWLIGRTVDYTDLAALVILPFTYKYAQTYKPLKIKSLVVYPVFALTIFGIMGTSPARYGTRMDVAEGNSVYQDKSTESEQYSAAMEAIHDAALLNGLKCISCNQASFHRKYEGKGVVLELNYAPDKKRVYIGIYSQEPYRTKYEEQKIAVEKIKIKLEEALKEHSYSTQAPEKASFADPYFEANLWVKSPTKGFPFASKANGLGNKDIKIAHAYVSEYLEKHGFRRAKAEYCYPVDSDFENQMCRRYISGRIVDSAEDSASSVIVMSGFVDWFGTYLHIEFRKIAKDESINLRNMAAELQTQLKERLPKDVEIEYEKVSAN